MSRRVLPANRFIVMAGVLSACVVALGSPSAAGMPESDARGDAGQVILAQAKPNPQPVPNAEANISTLHQKLQITPAQEAQFTAVVNVMRENARAAASAPQRPPANAPAVDDLRAYIQYSELELAGLKRLLPALEALYSTLSPTQKKTADAVFRQGPGG